MTLNWHSWKQVSLSGSNWTKHLFIFFRENSLTFNKDLHIDWFLFNFLRWYFTIKSTMSMSEEFWMLQETKLTVWRSNILWLVSRLTGLDLVALLHTFLFGKVQVSQTWYQPYSEVSLYEVSLSHLWMKHMFIGKWT